MKRPIHSFEALLAQYPLGREIVFNGKSCVVTGYPQTQMISENQRVSTFFLQLTERGSGDFVIVDPYIWGLPE